MLVILLPSRPRGDAPATSGNALSYVLTPDGVATGQAGHAEPAALPKADATTAVVPLLDLAWLRLPLPKAPTARLRQALASVAEDQLLDEPEQVHLALQPHARAGEPAWVAAVNRPWLVERLAELTAAGVVVDRLVPAAAPGTAACGHFVTGAEAGQGKADELWLSWTDTEHVMCVRTVGSLARALLPGWLARSPTWTATPAAAAAAERWLGAPVRVLSEAEHALGAARSPWNLRQFDLVLHARGLRALRDAARHVLRPAWRPVRWGLAALLAVHLIGLNAWAWQQQRALDGRRQAMTELLRSSHPQIRSVLDVPLQMQRETELLRAASGRAGEGDFETLLSQAATAWPEGRPPIEQLIFEPGRLVWPAAGWSAEQVQQLRTRIEQSGGHLNNEEGRLAIVHSRELRPAQRAAPSGSRSTPPASAAQDAKAAR